MAPATPRRALFGAALLLAAICLAFFGSVLGPGRTLLPSAWLASDSLYRDTAPPGIAKPVYHDLTPAVINHPYDVLFARSFRSGQLPLWNPWNGCGSPVLAHLQTSPFFPLKALFYVAPCERTYDWFLVSRHVLAAVGMLLLAHRLGMGLRAAFLAAAAYSLGGYMVGLTATTLASSAAVLPFLLLAADAAWASPGPRSAASLGFMIGLLGVSGHPESNFLVGFAGLLFLAARAAPRLRSPDRARLLRWLAAAAAIGLALNLHALLPFLELLKAGTTYKERPDVQTALRDQLAARDATLALPCLLAPRLLASRPDLIPYDTPRFYAHYPGLCVLALALFVLVLRRGDLPLLVLLLVGLGLGYQAPVLRLLYELPGFRNLYGSYALVLLSASIALLAGRGLDELERAARGGARLLGGLTAAVVLLLGWNLAMFSFRLSEIPPGSEDPLIAPGRSNLGAGLAFPVLVPLAALVSVFLSGPRRGLLVAGVAVADLIWSGLPLARGFPSFDHPDVEVAARLREASRGGRVLGLRGANHTPNLGAVTRLPDLRLTEALFVRRYDRFMKVLDPSLRDIFPTYKHVGVSRSPLLDIAAVRLVLQSRYPSTLLENLYGPDLPAPPADRLEDDPDLPLLFSTGSLAVYENRRALPRAFVATAATAARDEEEAARLLAEDQEEWRRSGRTSLAGRPVLEGARGGGTPSPPVPADVHDLSPTEVLVRARAPTGGWLVLSDTCYPGWKAEMDGRPAAILPANLAFRAVALPPGEHVVRFRYEPRSFRLGLALGCVALLVTLALAAGFPRRPGDGAGRAAAEGIPAAGPGTPVGTAS